MTPIKIGLLILAVAAGTVTAASVSGIGTIAFLSYHISGNQYVIPAHIKLNDLKLGESGHATAYAVVNVTSSGNYTIHLLKSGILKKDFSNFTVVLTIGNQTVTLTPKEHTALVELKSGVYNITINIYYAVASHVEGHKDRDFHGPLLSITPYSPSSSTDTTSDED